MTTDALDIYTAHLSEQLGENGLFTEQAVYDYDGDGIEISGIFECNDNRGDTDSGNAVQKKKVIRFIVSEIKNFNIHDDKKLLRLSTGVEYTIDYVDRDENGAQVIWLY